VKNFSRATLEFSGKRVIKHESGRGRIYKTTVNVFICKECKLETLIVAGTSKSKCQNCDREARASVADDRRSTMADYRRKGLNYENPTGEAISQSH